MESVLSSSRWEANGFQKGFNAALIQLSGIWMAIVLIALLATAVAVMLLWRFKSKERDRSSANPHQKNRRVFIGVILWSGLIGFLATVFYPIIRFLIPPKGDSEPIAQAVLAGTLDEFPPNSGKIIRFGNEPVIVIRTPSGDVRAFSAICTHLACIVQYRADFQHIWCACHNGHYDLNGKNIAGPPPRPLPPFSVKIKESKIFVSRV